MAAEKDARDHPLGQWPSPDAKAPATGGLGLTGDRSIAFLTCVCTGNALRRGLFLGRPLFASENQIVPVDHFGSACVAKDQQHVG